MLSNDCWLPGFADERIVLTTEARRFADHERVSAADLRWLLPEWLADRHARSELCRLYAVMTRAPEPPATWTALQIASVVGRFLEDAWSAGWLVGLRSPRRHSRGNLPTNPSNHNHPRTARAGALATATANRAHLLRAAPRR